jgi:hypothetical protein
MFDPKCAQIWLADWLVDKNNNISLSLLAFLIINVKILYNFYKEWCTFGTKKYF